MSLLYFLIMAVARSLDVLGTLEIRPHIAYHGSVPPWACDHTITPPFATWWEVQSGHVEVRTARGQWKVGRGQWILLPQGVRRHQIIRAGTVLTSLSFRASWPSGCPLFLHSDPLVSPAQPSPGRQARTVCREIRKQCTPGSLSVRQSLFHTGAWLNIQATLFIFLAALLEQLTAMGMDMHPDSWGHPRLDEVVRDLRRELKIGPLPYASWEKKWGTSRSTLDRLALRLLGHSLRAHRDTLLREELQRQLFQSALSAKELSVRYGFHDQAHFTRWVRQQTGSTPGNLRLGEL